MGRPPRAGTHPGGLLLGIQQGDVEGGRQAGGGEDISQGHAGFSQKPGGREHRGSAGEGVKEPHWGREQLLEIPSSIPRFGGKTATSQFGRCWEDARSLGAGLPALLRQRGDFWGLCALFSTKKKHLESCSGEQGAVSSLDGLSVPAAPRIKMGKETAWGGSAGQRSPGYQSCSRFLPHHFRRAGEPERFSHGEGTAFPSPSPSISSADGHGNRAVPPRRGAGSLLIALMGQHPGRGAARCRLRREGKAKSQRGRGQQTGEAPRGDSGGAQRSGCTPPQAAKKCLHQSRSLLPSAPLYL